jgi:hypothetical protein
MAPKKKPAAPKTEAKVEPKKNPRGELVTENLKFDLTQAEIAEKGELAADQSADLAKIKSEFKAVKSDFKGQIDTLQKDLDKNLACIKEGTEEREVQCIKVLCKDNDTVQFWFNGENLKERPATDLDRQKEMPFRRAKKDEVPFNGIVVEHKPDHKMAAAGDSSI